MGHFGPLYCLPKKSNISAKKLKNKTAKTQTCVWEARHTNPNILRLVKILDAFSAAKRGNQRFCTSTKT